MSRATGLLGAMLSRGLKSTRVEGGRVIESAGGGFYRVTVGRVTYAKVPNLQGRVLRKDAYVRVAIGPDGQPVIVA